MILHSLKNIIEKAGFNNRVSPLQVFIVFEASDHSPAPSLAY
jgi:hypothetical protein